jgi:hypothetical protein
MLTLYRYYLLSQWKEGTVLINLGYFYSDQITRFISLGTVINQNIQNKTTKK